MRVGIMGIASVVVLCAWGRGATEHGGDLNQQIMEARREVHARLREAQAAQAAWPTLRCGPLPVAPAGTVPPRLAPPANDNFANRVTLVGESGVAGGTLVDATFEQGEPFHPYWDCNSNSIWYTWTAPSSGTYCFNLDGSAATCELAVFTNGTFATLCKVHDYYGEAVSIDAVAGQTYQIVVVGCGATPSGLTTMMFYKETLDPWTMVHVTTNIYMKCIPLRNGTVLVAPQTDLYRYFVRENQFGVQSRHTLTILRRTRGFHVIDRRGVYVVSNAVPAGPPICTSTGLAGKCAPWEWTR